MPLAVSGDQKKSPFSLSQSEESLPDETEVLGKAQAAVSVLAFLLLPTWGNTEEKAIVAGTKADGSTKTKSINYYYYF